MSIESDIHDIAVSLAALVNHLTKQTPKHETTPHPQIPAPVSSAPAPAPVPPAPVAPAPIPEFVPPYQPAPTGVLTDPASVMAYCVAKYKQLGPVKGPEIQGVLLALGHQQLSGLRPDQYAEFHARVEAL
jgi:hypothetical protein